MDRNHGVTPDFIVETDGERVTVTMPNSLPDLQIEQNFVLADDAPGLFLSSVSIISRIADMISREDTSESSVTRSYRSNRISCSPTMPRNPTQTNSSDPGQARHALSVTRSLKKLFSG